MDKKGMKKKKKQEGLNKFEFQHNPALSRVSRNAKRNKDVRVGIGKTQIY